MDGFNHFAQISEQLYDAFALVVKKTAFDAKANIQAEIQSQGLIDTGFMINSVYTVTSDGSSYQGGEKALPPVEAPANAMSASVAVAASYAGFPNYGTVHQPARPFFEPGIDKTRPGLQASISAVANALK